MFHTIKTLKTKALLRTDSFFTATYTSSIFISALSDLNSESSLAVLIKVNFILFLEPFSFSLVFMPSNIVALCLDNSFLLHHPHSTLSLGTSKDWTGRPSPKLQKVLFCVLIVSCKTILIAFHLSIIFSRV